MNPGFPPAVTAAGLLWLSGHVAYAPATGQVLGSTFAEQAELVFAGLQTTLAGSGCSLADLVRVECFLTDPTDFPLWNETFARHFPADPPARTTLITALALPGLLLEIQGVAVLPELARP